MNYNKKIKIKKSITYEIVIILFCNSKNINPKIVLRLYKINHLNHHCIFVYNKCNFQNINQFVYRNFRLN